MPVTPGVGVLGLMHKHITRPTGAQTDDILGRDMFLGRQPTKRSASQLILLGFGMGTDISLYF